MNDLSDLTAIIEKMQKRAEEFTAKWDAWFAASGKPSVVNCQRHGNERVLSRALSLAESHSSQDLVARYEKCTNCKSEDVIREKSDRLREMGIIDENILHATFENFIVRTENDRDNLAKAVKFSELGRGFMVMLGSVGVGKSHLAVATMRAMDCSALFITQGRLLKKLRDTYRNDFAEDPVKVYSAIRLLVLDEVGVSGGGKDELPMLHEILSTRHETRKPTILTSNLTKDEFVKAIGDRMADRLKQSCAAKLEFGGESMRPRFRKEYQDERK